LIVLFFDFFKIVFATYCSSLNQIVLKILKVIEILYVFTIIYCIASRFNLKFKELDTKIL